MTIKTKKKPLAQDKGPSLLKRVLTNVAHKAGPASSNEVVPYNGGAPAQQSGRSDSGRSKSRGSQSGHSDTGRSVSGGRLSGRSSSGCSESGQRRIEPTYAPLVNSQAMVHHDNNGNNDEFVDQAAAEANRQVSLHLANDKVAHSPSNAPSRSSHQPAPSVTSSRGVSRVGAEHGQLAIRSNTTGVHRADDNRSSRGSNRGSTKSSVRPRSRSSERQMVIHDNKPLSHHGSNSSSASTIRAPSHGPSVASCRASNVPSKASSRASNTPPAPWPPPAAPPKAKPCK
jgi:hypothetical protein